MKIHTYQDAMQTLANNPARDSHVYSRLLAPNTRLVFGRVQPNSISLVFYTTAVITWYMDGRITYNSGGFRTATTKTRLNDFGPFHVYQESFAWYVRLPVSGHIGFTENVLFTDNMQVSGTPPGIDLSRMRNRALPL